MNYFDNAEQEHLPKTFVNYNWGEIKKFFSAYHDELRHAFDKLNREINKSYEAETPSASVEDVGEFHS